MINLDVRTLDIYNGPHTRLEIDLSSIGVTYNMSNTLRMSRTNFELSVLFF